MNALKIIKIWLKENGCDGLYEPGECGCLIEDLAPCESEGALHCLPGYKSDATEETCFRKSDGYDWIVGPEKAKEDGKQ